MNINLSDKFPRDVSRVAGMAGRVADREGMKVYMVGGPVRDIFLKRPNLDLDFVVEGDAIRFAGLFSSELKGRMDAYRAFGTATIKFRDKRVDVVTARKETYERPGAYPRVRPGTIREDLFRRDFTINAMAVSVNSETFGGLVDFYGGLRDLKKGVIRVMHDKSFIDDPTRIFRAVRFSARLGFRIEPKTKILMREALSRGFLGEVNRGRVKKEIELFLREKEPYRCLVEFGRLI
ncbi:MAG: hypothetical protein WC569_04195 [Candidatus Omnitrophota bacterium]